MRPSDAHAKVTQPQRSQTPAPILFNWLGQEWKVRPTLVAYDFLLRNMRQLALWTPMTSFLLERQTAKGSKQWHQLLAEYAREHGTSEAYSLVLPMIRTNYEQLAKSSWTGKMISEHSTSMMSTFRGANSPLLPGFSAALSQHSLSRAPVAPSSDANLLKHLGYHWKLVKAYTLAHNDAYKEMGVDRHFTPAWLTEFVILGKGVASMAPGKLYTPVNTFYGALTGTLALTFNPTQDYDSSDFAKRTLLYTGISYPMLRTAIPRLFMCTAQTGSTRLRIINVSASMLLGGAYEFYCGFKQGTGYMTKGVKSFTFVEKDE